MAFCAVPIGHSFGPSITGDHGVVGSTLIRRGSCIKIMIITRSSPSTHMLSMWYGNPKTFFIVYCLDFADVQRMFCSGDVHAPYWSTSLASFTMSTQFTVGWWGGGEGVGYGFIFPMVGMRMVAPSSRFPSLPLGGCPLRCSSPTSTYQCWGFHWWLLQTYKQQRNTMVSII